MALFLPEPRWAPEGPGQVGRDLHVELSKKWAPFGGPILNRDVDMDVGIDTDMAHDLHRQFP